MEKETFYYDNRIVRNFAFATIFWGAVAMLMGVLVACQIVIPKFNLGIEFTTFGRTRPIHTNAAIFAFVGNAIFAGVYYSMQRLLKTRMYSDILSKVHFWGWQLIIVSGAITLALGKTTSKEYAELEWPIDIAITFIWVVFGWNMFGTLLKRRVKHLYVAIWFYIATFCTVAVLHIVNSFEIPVSFLKSYPIYAGVQDALVQWWYGHNAVAFFLTTPYLGLMYYFVPKAANRPIYSYRLSIIHFWALIFIYIWAGPHHLLYTALPEWAQSLGTAFSIMLIAPSWGGMLNGLLTLRGAWDRVRTDPILKFFVVAITAYGMATLEGPTLALKSVNALSHYTDWTIAHVHVGTLGWNGFLTFGMLYWMIPKLFNTRLASVKMANVHFWIGTLGILFYVIPMYWSGWTQTMMWKEFNDEGYLQYPSFIYTLTEIVPMHYMRIAGGSIYLTGVILMIINLARTVLKGKMEPDEQSSAVSELKVTKTERERGHRLIESRPIQMLIVATIVILIGGLVEMIPTFLVESNIPTIESVKPYTPLELAGRDIYVREGCYTCHSQMIRPFRHETARYGEYSKAGEFVYDHPFQWGSKRTGPDLAREGYMYGPQYKPDAWHYGHLVNPRNYVEQSVMPEFPWLAEKNLNVKDIPKKIRVMQKMGVPYPAGYDTLAVKDLKKQAEVIADGLKEQGIETSADKEIIALIAYLQRLGSDIMEVKEEEDSTKVN